MAKDAGIIRFDGEGYFPSIKVSSLISSSINYLGPTDGGLGHSHLWYGSVAPPALLCI